MKRASRSRGITSTSTASQTSKNTSKTEKISKYFQKNTCTDVTDFESPYRHLCSEIKTQPNDSVSDESDFKTPIVTKKYNAPKILKEKKKKIKQTKLTTKFTNTNNKVDIDVNLDHLQMAIALSKSSYESENPDTPLENSEEEKISVKFGTLKTTLEKFGFKSNKNTLRVQNKRSNELTSKKRKGSKFKYITPTLVTRTAEDRESLITSKISLILSQTIPNTQRKIHEPTTFITDIKNHLCNESFIFKLNNIPIEKLKQDFFYPVSLNVPKSQIKGGYLLKNWSKIPGREISPERLQNKDTSIKKDTADLRDTTLINKSPEKSTTISFKDTEMEDISDIKDNDIKDTNDLKDNTIMIDTIDIKESIKIPESKNSNISNFKDTISLTTRSISPDLFGSDDENYDYVTSCESKLEISKKDFTSPKIKDNTLERYDFEEDKDDLEVTTLLEKSQELLENINFEIKDSDFKDTKLENKDVETFDLTISSDDEIFSFKDTSQEIKDTSDKIKDISVENKNISMVFEDFNIKIENTLGKIKDISKEIKDTNTEIQTYDLTLSSDEEISPKKDISPAKSSEKSLNNSKKSLNLSQISKSSASTSRSSLNISKDLNYSSQSGIIHYNSYSKDRKSFNSFSSENDEELNVEKIKDICTQSSYDITKEDSIDYNSTKSLNVTEYVTQMLNGKKKIETVSDSDEDNDNSQCSSQRSFVFDEELNYSCHFATPAAKRSLNQMDEFCDQDSSPTHLTIKSPIKPPKITEKIRVSNLFNDTFDNTALLQRVLSLEQEKVDCNNSPMSRRSLEQMEFVDDFCDNMPSPSHVNNFSPKIISPTHNSPILNRFNTTLDNTAVLNKIMDLEEDKMGKNRKTPSNYIIKKNNITPMPNYEDMDTPKIKNELDKFGLKPLKRQRGINLLKHIYDTTHPVLNSTKIDTELPISKKRKLTTSKPGIPALLRECPNFSDNLDDLVFERKFSTKIPSCRIPLQIVWFNFLQTYPDIFENILLYEPLQLEVIHKMLKELGFKFHIDDLLGFLDKKCITIRTAPGNQHRKK